jgi:hypothetical protein
MKKKTWRIIVLSLAAVIIIVMMILPVIIRTTVVKNSPEWIGRQIELEGLKVNYFTATIRLRDFKMYEANGKDVFVQFDTLTVDLEPWQVLLKDFIIEECYLSGLKVSIVQNDTLFNFDDLVAFHTAPDTTKKVEEAEQDTAGSSYTMQLSNIRLFNGDIVFRDAEVNEQIALRGIDLSIPYFGWDTERDRASGLRFNFENGGYLQLNADWDPITKNLEGTVLIDSLDLVNFYGYSKKFVNLGSLGGTVDARIDVHRPRKDLATLKLSGMMDVNNLLATAMDGDTIAGFRQLHLSMDEIKPLQQRILLDSIILDSLHILFERYDSVRTNFGELIKVNEIDSTETVQVTTDVEHEEEIALYYSLASLKVKNSKVMFVDKSMDQTFRYELTEIETGIDSINSDNRWIDVVAKMKLNNRGNLTAELGVNPADPMNLKLFYVITDFQLSDLNIYSTHYAGLPILYGDMFYKSETTIDGGILDSKNELILEDVELGDQSASALDLPIGFALFILKDKNGNITLDVPVQGDLNEPGISVQQIVWDTFKGFIGKIAAAPFKALGNLFGMDPKDIKDIEYAYGEAELTEKRKKQLEKLLELESKKADLGIELVYFNDVEKEREAVATDMVGQKFNNKKRDYRKDKKEFEAYVRRKVKNDTLELGQACLSLVKQSKVDSLVAGLKTERITSLETYLAEQSDSTAISFYIPEADAPKNIGSQPVFEMKYSMRKKDIEDPEVKTEAQDSLVE